MSDWREWGSHDWPGWKDIGKLAEFKMEGGEIVRGKLKYEEMTPWPCEHPLVYIERADGTRAPLGDARLWRYVE